MSCSLTPTRTPYSSYPPALYAHILSLFPAPVTTLVDIGCGPGLSTFPFATSSSASSELKVLGVDPGAGMVQTAKDLTKERGLEGKVKFVQGGAETLGQVLSEGEKVDGVVAGECMTSVVDVTSITDTVFTCRSSGALVRRSQGVQRASQGAQTWWRLRFLGKCPA